MPCQPEEADQCAPVQKKQSNPCALVHTKSKINPSLFGQFMSIESIASKAHSPSDGWIYLLKPNATQTYDSLDMALKRIDEHLSHTAHTSCSQFHAVGPNGERIMLGGCHPLFREIVDANGELCAGVSVWHMNKTLPPRKRPMATIDKENEPSKPAPKPDRQLLIPGFKRLSRQLQVDFSVNVHGSEGKRRREPVRSIYEDAAHERANHKKRVRKVRPPTNDCGDISSMDEDELLHHAETLVSLSSGDASPEKRMTTSKKQTLSDNASIISSLARAMDVVSQAHAHTLGAKDETIKAMDLASKALAETVRTQAALIAQMRRE